MSQLQKRCFFASVGAHGLLLLVILVGSAFFIPKSSPIRDEGLRVVPSRLIDEALSGGGGNPSVPNTPEPQIQKGDTLEVAQPPEPTPPPPEPKPEVKAETKPKPLEVKPDKKPDPKPEKNAETKPEKPKDPPPEQRKITLDDLKLVKEKPKDAKPSQTKGPDLAKEIAKLRQDLKTGFNNGTVVVPFGPGGEAYADYASFVKAVYDNAWILTENLADNGASTKVEVVIARDGDVVSARIIRSSGNAGLDQSVQGVLRKVKFVAPFPVGARDKTRSFKINFNLKNKIGAG